MIGAAAARRARKKTGQRGSHKTLVHRHASPEEIEKYKIEIQLRREKNHIKRTEDIAKLRERLTPKVYNVFEKLFSEFDDDNNSKCGSASVTRYPKSMFRMQGHALLPLTATHLRLSLLLDFIVREELRDALDLLDFRPTDQDLDHLFAVADADGGSALDKEEWIHVLADAITPSTDRQQLKKLISYLPAETEVQTLGSGETEAERFEGLIAKMKPILMSRGERAEDIDDFLRFVSQDFGEGGNLDSDRLVDRLLAPSEVFTGGRADSPVAAMFASQAVASQSTATSSTAKDNGSVDTRDTRPPLPSTIELNGQALTKLPSKLPSKLEPLPTTGDGSPNVLTAAAAATLQAGRGGAAGGAVGAVGKVYPAESPTAPAAVRHTAGPPSTTPRPSIVPGYQTDAALSSPSTSATAAAAAAALAAAAGGADVAMVPEGEEPVTWQQQNNAKTSSGKKGKKGMKGKKSKRTAAEEGDGTESEETQEERAAKVSAELRRKTSAGDRGAMDRGPA
jgi:Ca2+-binding EF-hand superfamily protein